MKVNMKELNPATRFYFAEDKDSGSIDLRVMSSAKLAEVRDKTIQKQVEYKNNNRFEFHNIDHGLRDKIIWDYCIVDWQGLEDDTGEPIECTTENKLKLMNEYPGFAGFVEEKLGVLNGELEKRRDYLEKN